MKAPTDDIDNVRVFPLARLLHIAHVPHVKLTHREPHLLHEEDAFGINLGDDVNAPDVGVKRLLILLLEVLLVKLDLQVYGFNPGLLEAGSESWAIASDGHLLLLLVSHAEQQ